LISELIRWSIRNRVVVLLAAALLSGWGLISAATMPLDAIPDLSDVQVVLRTSYSGQAPQVVEDQITYPLSTAMLSVPGVVAVRGYSFFGDSYVYAIFSDDTDLYWARSRVLEYLSQVSDQLPKGVRPRLGPDATGVGWIYQYALLDRSGGHDLAQLRTLQDWFLRYELQTVSGVAEVATVGGMVREVQVVIDPDKLRGYSVTLRAVRDAIAASNLDLGGSVLELAEAEYMVRFKGSLESVDQMGSISVPTLPRRHARSSVLLDDLALGIEIGPASRRGVADLDGEGEVVGGIVVMRTGEDVQATIQAVKSKLDELRRSLPAGVELIETYDRSTLIEAAVASLRGSLIEECLVVVLVCAAFLSHVRSSLVILLSLPVGILAAFVLMRLQGINANIMSLGGIAIAVGAMVDAAIVMIENTHKRLESCEGGEEERLATIREACARVGAPLFYSLLIITLSFLPIFALEAQEARLFEPLAFTKTFAMVASAGLSITLVPALIALFIRGRVRPEEDNPINRWLISAYRPLAAGSLERPWTVLVAAVLLVCSVAWPLSRLGSEFLPEMDEGDLLYMPTTLPGVSVGKARELLQQTDRLIKTVPEVDRVFGKVGRADTATDPAPLTMIETVIRLKPRDQWRPGMTPARVREELDRVVQIPSLRNAWLRPIRTRIDMQSTGINTPIGIKIAGPDLAEIQRLGAKVEAVLHSVGGTRSVLSDRSAGARYIDIEIDREVAGHYGLSIAEIEESASIAIGGADVTHTVEGRERYAVNLRYPQSWRDSVSGLRELPLVLRENLQLQLQDVAEIRIADGPPVIKSENGRLNGWVYVTTNGRDMGSYVREARAALRDGLQLPAGYTLSWAGQYQYLQRGQRRLLLILPLTLLIILMLLHLIFRSLPECFIVLMAVPLALSGGIWLVWLLGYHFSIAVGVGFIAMAGVAAEFGVVMLVYLREAIERRAPSSDQQLRESIMEGAVLRVRPKAMTASVISIGLLPILLSDGIGSEVMKRIAAPMVGGMVTAPLAAMLVIPVMYLMWRRRDLAGRANRV